MAQPAIAEKKALGQYYTPDWVVNLILDRLQYNGAKILNKRVFDPGCGSGNFLHEAARRFLAAAKAAQLGEEETRKRLRELFYAVEICPRATAECRARLNALAQEYGIANAQWNIVNADVASLPQPQNFDFVVGNPPYVRVHNMDAARRRQIKERFSFCNNGIIDLFLAFFELGICALRPGAGQLGFITPNSFIHNSTYARFRRELAERGWVREIIDFKAGDIFADASTYNAVTILSAGGNGGATRYCEGDKNGIRPLGKIDLAKQDAKKWNLTGDKDAAFLDEILRGGRKIGEHAVVQYGFATLLDSAYIVRGDSPFGEAESGIVYPALKATRHNGDSIGDKIIYPYARRNGAWRALTEAELQGQYPRVYRHLLARKTALQKRNLDAGAQWHEYGRSQGVQTMHHPKLAISPIFKDKIRVFKASAKTMVYSGMFLFAPRSRGLWQRPALSDYAAILQSERFLRYARLVGKDMRGGYKVINTKAVKEYSP